MKTKKDLQMLLLGLVMGVLVTLVLGAAAPKSTNPGRYQIAGTGNNGLVLDTATGEVWSYDFKSSGGGASRGFFEPKLDAKQ